MHASGFSFLGLAFIIVLVIGLLNYLIFSSDLFFCPFVYQLEQYASAEIALDFADNHKLRSLLIETDHH